MEDTINYKAIRRELHEAVNSAILGADSEITGITGWILIAEAARGPNIRSLIAIAGDIIGDNDIPSWTARGWLDEISEDVSYYLGPDPEDFDE